MDHDISATLSQKASKPLAVLPSPHTDISLHPRRLAVRSMATECVIEFDEGHVAVEHRQRHDAHYWITAYDKRSIWKLVGVDLMGHASSIIANQTVCKWGGSRH